MKIVETVASGLRSLDVSVLNGVFVAPDSKRIENHTLSQISQKYNLVINGNFNVWQRGTSFSSAGYVSDRFKNTSATEIIREENDVPIGSKYALKSTATTTIRQYIEDGEKLINGREVTVSFMLKGGCSIDYADANGSSKFSSNAWEKFSHTFVAEDVNNLGGIYASFLDFSLDAGTMITQIKMEFGSVATDFYCKGYGFDLLLCQRFYERNNDLRRLRASRNIGSTTYSQIQVSYKVEKRVAPTVSCNLNLTPRYPYDVQNEFGFEHTHNTDEEFLLRSWTADAEI